MANRFVAWKDAERELHALWIAAQRNMGIDSPMNVWRKKFTKLSIWDELRIEAQRDYEYFQGADWAPIGSTVRIKTPARYLTPPQ